MDERERDKDVWLDPLTRGSELHDLYAALLRRCRDDDRGADREEGRRLADAGCAKDAPRTSCSARCRRPPRRSSSARVRDFLADVELFLDGECADVTTRTPIGFEVSFGRPLGADEDEPLARAEPVEIDLGGGLTFRIAGRIDRIDKVGPTAFEVLDYKTGGFWRDDWKGTFNGGRRLQHALYGLAAVELLRGALQEPQGHRRRLLLLEPQGPAGAGADRRAVTERRPQRCSRDLRELIVDGRVRPRADEKDCKFCDYDAACGERVHDAGRRQARRITKLTAYGRLAAHV